MTVARDQHTNNVVLGAGEIYIDRYGADGNPTNRERYLGDSVGGTISITTERTTIQSGDGQVAQDLVDIIRSVSRTMGFTLHDMSLENWGLFLIGGDPVSLAAVSATEITDEVIGNLKAGESYLLGIGPNRPSGVGELSAKPSAKNGDGNGNAITPANVATKGLPNGDTAKIPASEIIIDIKAGMVTAVKDQTNLRVTYTPAAKSAGDSRIVKATKETQSITCAIRYIEDAPGGAKGRNVYVRKANLVPAGEMALKSRDTEQQMAFTGTVVEPAAGWAFISIDDVPLTPEAA